MTKSMHLGSAGTPVGRIKVKLSASIDLANLLQRSDTAYHLQPRLNWTPQNWNSLLSLRQLTVHCRQMNNRNLSFFGKKKKSRFPHIGQTSMLTLDWQGLFRNYGDVFLPLLWPHLEQLASDPHESSQRCVCEITAGLIRGSKLWSFSKVLDTHTQQQIHTLHYFLIRKVNINKNFHYFLCVRVFRWTGYGSFCALWSGQH